MNQRVRFVRTEDDRLGAKKSFTQLYGASRVHEVRGMALNADWSSFGTK